MNFANYLLLLYFGGIFPINVMCASILILNTSTKLALITNYRLLQNLIILFIKVLFYHNFLIYYPILTILVLNDYFFNRFSEIYSLIIILPVLDFTILFWFILSWRLTSPKQKAWGKIWRTWCTFWSTCGKKFLYLAKNYLNIFVFASNQLAIRKTFWYMYLYLSYTRMHFPLICLTR